MICAHYEDIEYCDGDEYGTCRKCGQVKRYFWGNRPDSKYALSRQFEIIIPGKEMKEEIIMSEEEPKRLRTVFNKETREELATIGVEAFMQKHGYTKRASSAITQAYRKELARRGLVEGPPTGVTKECREPAGSGIHPLINTIVEELPKPGTLLSDSRKAAFERLFSNALDVIYKRQEVAA